MKQDERDVLEEMFPTYFKELRLVNIGNAKQVLDTDGELLAYLMRDEFDRPYLKPSLWKGKPKKY